MIVNILVSVILILTTLFFFKRDTRDIFLEKKKFSLSKSYFIFPLVYFGIGLYALLTANFSAYRLSTILLVIPATLAIAINEEILTRGILLTALRKKGVAEWLVFAITTVVFAIIHFINGIGTGSYMQVLVVAFGGALLYIARRVFNNLFMPILIHAFFDSGIYLQIGQFLESQNLPDNILDFNLASFLIMVLTVIIFIIFGRKLLAKETVVSEGS